MAGQFHIFVILTGRLECAPTSIPDLSEPGVRSALRDSLLISSKSRQLYYFRDGGHLAGRVEGSYNLYLTQRLIVQPQVEVNFYGKSDPARGIGTGLSDLDSGLRLGYRLPDLAEIFAVRRPHLFQQFRADRNFRPSGRSACSYFEPGCWNLDLEVRCTLRTRSRFPNLERRTDSVRETRSHPALRKHDSVVEC